MEANRVVYQVSEELQGRHSRVESGGALDLPIPRLAHQVHDESDATFVGGVIYSVVIFLVGVFCNGILDGLLDGVFHNGFAG